MVVALNSKWFSSLRLSLMCLFFSHSAMTHTFPSLETYFRIMQNGCVVVFIFSFPVHLKMFLLMTVHYNTFSDLFFTQV